MDKSDILKSIGDKVTAIDMKLETLVKEKDTDKDDQLNQIKNFFEELAEIINVKFIGDLPHAIEQLEKKINNFDFHTKENLKIFSSHLKDYEQQLSKEIKDEIQVQQEKTIARLDKNQSMHAEKLSDIIRVIDNLGTAITRLHSVLVHFDTKRLNENLENLEKLIEKQMDQGKSKFRFFRRKKKKDERKEEKNS